MRLKRFGLGFHPISEQITAVGRGAGSTNGRHPCRARTFPENYHFSTTGAFGPTIVRLKREPSLTGGGLRRWITPLRSPCTLRVQPGIKKTIQPASLRR